MSALQNHIVFVAFAGLFLSDGAIAADSYLPEQTLIPGEISDGKPSPPAPEPVRPDFVVKSTVVKEIDVVEAPPMTGLPSVTGTITLTVHAVEDPKLPDPPPPPVPAAAPDDPAVLARIAELRGKYRWPVMVNLSATVYDHSRTLFRYQPAGKGRKQITGWSNIDFNCFCGFTNYQVKGTDGEIHEFGLVMGLGNEDTKQGAGLLAKDDMAYDAPEIPTLPDLASGGPAFVIAEGDPNDLEAKEVIRGMHELYRVEGPRMEEAYQARIKAEAARRAYLIAHPPVPKDVTMNFWERSHPVGMSADTIKTGGGN